MSLAECPKQEVSIEQLRAAIIDADSYRHQRTILFALTDGGGNVRARYREVAPPNDVECADLAQELCSVSQFSWKPQWLVLINRPLYIVLEAGVLLEEDGTIIAESVFPSTGDKSIARQFGGALNSSNLRRALNDAPTTDRAVWAPLLSRWSAVYGHAVTECLVQNTMFSALGLSETLFHPIPEYEVAGAQRIVVSHACCRLKKFAAPIVKIPRGVFSTAFFKHAALGNLFRQFVDKTNSSAGPNTVEAVESGEKIYVSRIGAESRRMTNEPELIARLGDIGFSIFRGQGQSFERQVAAFRKASLVVGPYGSGLTNIAFAKPGGTLCELRPLHARGHVRMRVDEYARICGLMGIFYCAHVSPNDIDADKWEANIPEILKIAQELS